MIEHRGDTLNSGHYVAYLNFNDKWIECNDEFVNEPTQFVMNQKFRVSPTAESRRYILVYEFAGNTVAALAPVAITRTIAATTKLPQNIHVLDYISDSLFSKTDLDDDTLEKYFNLYFSGKDITVGEIAQMTKSQFIEYFFRAISK